MLLRSIKEGEVRNVVWLTADVHYARPTTTTRRAPGSPISTRFWEFVAGPMNAGTFGPGTLDATFGPEVRFCSVPQGMKPNRPPSEGRQFFGTVRIDGKTGGHGPSP